MNDVFKNVDTTLIPKRPEIFEGAQSTENDSVEPAVLLFQGADLAFEQPATEPANHMKWERGRMTPSSSRDNRNTGKPIIDFIKA